MQSPTGVHLVQQSSYLDKAGLTSYLKVTHRFSLVSLWKYPKTENSQPLWEITELITQIEIQSKKKVWQEYWVITLYSISSVKTMWWPWIYFHKGIKNRVTKGRFGMRKTGSQITGNGLISKTLQGIKYRTIPCHGR